MNFTTIDLNTWDRKEHFLHYYQDVKCTYSLTCQLDITNLYHRAKEQGVKLYPALIWLVSNGVNNFQLMRFEHDENKNVGYYDVLNPSFTFMPENSENFCSLWAEYAKDFSVFNKNYNQVIEKYKNTKEMHPQKDTPKNCFDISSIPWVEFTGFNLNLHTDGTWLLPILTTGKLIKNQDKVSIPFCVQVHHSVCDGFYCAKFLEYLETLARDCDVWLEK